MREVTSGGVMETSLSKNKQWKSLWKEYFIELFYRCFELFFNSTPLTSVATYCKIFLLDNQEHFDNIWACIVDHSTLISWIILVYIIWLIHQHMVLNIHEIFKNLFGSKTWKPKLMNVSYRCPWTQISKRSIASFNGEKTPWLWESS